jgi:two-component system OmpR family sensor kinase
VIRFFGSTRGRLVLVAVGVIAAALVITDGIVLASTTTAQWQQSDAVLVSQARLLASDLQDSNGQVTFGSEIPTETQSGIAVDAAVVAGTSVIAHTANQPLPLATLSRLAAQAISSGNPVFADLTDSNNVPRRVYAVALSGSPGQAIVVSRSVGELQDAQARTLASLLLVSSVLLIMGAVLSYWLAGRALTPVRRIATTARSISERDLSRRVEVKVPPDELGELVDTFNSMLARLEAGFKSMGRFTADASHELRAPLALMRSELEGSLSRTRTKEEYRQALESIRGEVDHLSRLTDQLLILARADAGALVPAREQVDVTDFLHETGARWESVAEKSGVHIDVAAPASGSVDADPRLLRRVMDNLVDNAIRHSPQGSAVTMRAVVANGGWNVEVVDRGPGVPPDHRERLFSRFSRPDHARSQEEGGAGLGLALSAAIARAHGGSLDLVENGATGAVFRLHLPKGRES